MRITRGRESWPLVSNVQLALLPGQISIIQSQVAPPIYVVDSSRILKRRNDQVQDNQEGRVHPLRKL
jgi:hypothetical protein